MGLDYDYRIYVKKKNLRSTMEYIFQNCEKSRSGFEFVNSDLFRLNRLHYGVERRKIENDGLNQDFDCCLIFANDDKIWEYHLNDLSEGFNPSSREELDNLSTYQVDANNFWIGNIEVRVRDYTENIRDTVEISFLAVSSRMSELFRDSNSIDKFFKRLCKEVEADYGYLSKESEGYKLIWFEGRETNFEIQRNDHLQTFDKLGFIPVIKSIMDKRKL